MVERISTAKMTEAEWQDERKKSIGGSEISAVLGLNPWESAYSLWAKKTGRVPPFEGNVNTRIGLFLEDVVAQLFTEASGLKVWRTNFIYRNSEFPWLHASPDRLIVGQRSGLEIKTTSALNTSKFRNGKFPEEYYAQSVQYMAVLEYERWFVAVLIGNRELKIYQLTTVKDEMTPDWCESSLYVEPGEIEALIDAGRRFHDVNMLKDIAPEADGSDATQDALRTIYADSRPGWEKDLHGMEGTIAEYKGLEDAIKGLEERKDAVKASLQLALGEAEVGVAGPYKISWKSQERKTLDTKLLQAAFKGALDPYYKVTKNRVFRIA